MIGKSSASFHQFNSALYRCKNSSFKPSLYLTSRDRDIADFIEEMGACLEGHLTLLDAVSKILVFNWY